MASAIDYTRLRRDVGATETDLPDAQAELLFTEAAEEYSGAASIKAQTRILALQGMLGSSARDVDYQQNEARESLSDVSTNLQKLLDVWEKRLADALAREANTVTPGVRPPSFNARVVAGW